MRKDFESMVDNEFLRRKYGVKIKGPENRTWT